MTKLELRKLLREEIRKVLNESTKKPISQRSQKTYAKKYSLNEQVETVTVLYVQGAQNWDVNSGKYISLDQSAVQNAISQGSYVQIPNTTINDVIDDIYSNNAEYPKDAEYPGQDEPKVKSLFRQNMRALVKGADKADDIGDEGWFAKHQKQFNVNGAQAIAVPIGYAYTGRSYQSTPVMTALVGGPNLIK